MKKYFPFLILFWFLIPAVAYAQIQPVHSFQARLAPLNMLDPVTPTLQGGIQYTYQERIGVSVDYGYQTGGLSLPIRQSNFQDHSYYKVRSEIKYFGVPRQSGSGKTKAYPYYGLEGFYIPQSYSKENDWFERGDTQYAYEYSEIEKKVLGAGIKAGLEVQFNKRFVLDIYAGAGLRRVNIQHHATGLRETEILVKDEWVRQKDRNERTNYYFHMPLGVKVGYIFLSVP